MDTEELAPVEGAVEGVEAPEENDQQKEQSLGVDDIASQMGWTPQNDWRGDPDKWKPAEAYLVDTAKVNKNLSSSVKSLESKMDVMARTSARLTEQAVEKERTKILEKRQQAFDDGDADAFTEADEKLQTLNVPITEQALPAETQKFMDDNAEWFNKNDDATRLAIDTAERYKNLSPAKQLEMAGREVKKVFPELFPQKAQPKAPALNSPGARGGSAITQKFTMANLPAEARKMAEDYANKGISNNDFLAAYNEENGQ